MYEGMKEVIVGNRVLGGFKEVGLGGKILEVGGLRIKIPVDWDYIYEGGVGRVSRRSILSLIEGEGKIYEVIFLGQKVGLNSNKKPVAIKKR